MPVLRLSRVLSVGLVLTAGCGSDSGAPSTPVATHLVVIQEPPSTITNGVAIGPAIVVELRTAGNAPAAVAGVPIHAKLGVAARTLAGDTVVTTDDAGRATFPNLAVTGPTGGIAISFSSPGLGTVMTWTSWLMSGAPVNAQRISIDSQVGPVSALEVTVAPTLRISDLGGNGVAGITVVPTILSGGGSLAPPADGYLSDANGIVSVTGWRLGPVPASNSLSVTVASHPELGTFVFQAAGVVGPPGLVGLSQPSSPVLVDGVMVGPATATVTDARGNALAHVPVVFHVVSGPAGSVLTGATTATDSLGRATLAGWHVGTTAGVYGLRASADTAKSPVRYVTASPLAAVRVVGVTPDGVVERVGLADSVRFRAVDPFGNPVPLSAVSLAIDSGAATLTPPGGTTDSAGELVALVTPTALGALVVRASLDASPDSIARITGHAVAPVDLVAFAGDSQVGRGSTMVPTPPRFRVVDSVGAGVAGVPLVVRGSRGLRVTARTDSLGDVTLSGITFPSQAGASTYRATTAWLPGDTATVHLTSTVGRIASFDSISAGGPYVVKTLPDSAPIFRALDSLGNGVPGIFVNFVGPSGSFSQNWGITDSLGYVHSGTWTPDYWPGVRAVGVVWNEISRDMHVYFHPGPVASIVRSPYGPQRPWHAFAGEHPIAALRLLAADAYGNTPEPATVSASVMAGGGSITGAITIDTAGIITVKGWTMGPAAGINTLRLTVGTAVKDLSIDAAPPSPFHITLRGVPEWYTEIFADAVYQWRRRITASLPDQQLSVGYGACYGGSPAFQGTVDDILIDVTLAPIDGYGGILGGAGPCVVRGTNGLPVYGGMVFDVSDLGSVVQDGTIYDLFTHEIGHVLGIGSLWHDHSLLRNAGGSDPQYTGAGGKLGWAELGGSGNVPVEDQGGPGTRDVHWSESAMPSELMTGWLSNTVNPMSRVTIRSLADLGYQVDAASADAYTIGTAPPAPGLRRPARRISDEVAAPRLAVDAEGKVRPLP